MNPYEILGVSQTATREEIRSAYRKLSHDHHPDKGGATDRMQEINRAYAVLEDAETRASYDRTGFCGEDDFSEAERTLLDIFAAVLASAQAGNDLVKQVRARVNADIALLEKRALAAHLEVLRITKLQGAVQCEGRRNLFSILLERKIKEASSAATQYRAAIAIGKEMLTLLQSYSCRRKGETTEDALMRMMVGMSLDSRQSGNSLFGV